MEAFSPMTTRTTLHATASELGPIGWLNRVMLFLIATAVVAGVVAKFFPLIQKNIRMQREVHLLQDEVRRLQMEQNRNQVRIHALQVDPRVVERELRERHGYARPGEQVVTFRFLEPATPSSPQ
jgi:cell division protein FtsB